MVYKFSKGHFTERDLPLAGGVICAVRVGGFRCPGVCCFPAVPEVGDVVSCRVYEGRHVLVQFVGGHYRAAALVGVDVEPGEDRVVEGARRARVLARW